jgi:murein DD-endopeptidase MepM/ murein hydrolase activator NlpD
MLAIASNASAQTAVPCVQRGVESDAPVFCGAASQGGLIWADANGFDVYNGDSMVSRNGKVIVPIDRDARDTLQLKFCMDGNCGTFSYPVKQRKYPQQKLAVPPKFVEYDAETKRRIDRESAEITAARIRAVSDTALFFTELKLPKNLAAFKQTSVFGAARVYNNKTTGWHGGLDFGTPIGTAVYPLAAGKIILTGSHYLNGNIIIVSHGYGITSAYLHLNKILVGVGDKITADTKIAESGNTGRGTGAHLHVQLDAMDGNNKNMHIDPDLFIKAK